MKKVTTFLWFDGHAEEAARFYASVFPGGKVTQVMPGPGGKAMSATFEIDGTPFVAFNGGPHFQLTPAVSLFVECADQAEVDALWTRLLEGGGKESQCGWLVDRYSLSWQVIPKQLMEMMSSPEREKSGRAMQAMLGMKKLDIGALRKAFDGA